MNNIISSPAFAPSIGVNEKFVNDLSNFTNYVVNPRAFELYVGKDQHIYSESLGEINLPKKVAQLFERAFYGDSFSTREHENKQIFRLAQKAFTQVLCTASEDPAAAKYLAQLEKRLESAPESQAKTSLIAWIQAMRQEWKLDPKQPKLIHRNLEVPPPENPNIAQVAKDGFAKLKIEHTTGQALSIAVNPFSTLPGNLNRMIEKKGDLMAAAHEVADFYQAVQEFDRIAPAISPENKTLIQNCLTIYALNAERVVGKYRGGESALQTVFDGQKRPSEEISQAESAHARR